MRPKLALWLLPVFIPGGECGERSRAQRGGAASIPIFNPSSVSGAVGDYTLDCSGGMLVASTLMNFSAFMNVSALNTGGWILTDGVNNFAGMLVDRKPG